MRAAPLKLFVSWGENKGSHYWQGFLPPEEEKIVPEKIGRGSAPFQTPQRGSLPLDPPRKRKAPRERGSEEGKK